MNNLTTRELLSTYIDLEIEGELCPDEDVSAVGDALIEVQQQMRDKVDSIDYFMLELNKKESLINAEIEVIKQEEKRLRVRRKAVESLKKYFNEILLPMVITELGDRDGVYETDTARYKMFDAWGPVTIYNESEVPDDFMTIKTVYSVNKKKAREILKEGASVPGLGMTKVKRIRRS